MVLNADRRGFHEWVVQRVSAVLIGVYAVFLLTYLYNHQPMSYPVWKALFSGVPMQIATFVVVVSILWHAWIGLWTVFTDYVKNSALRLLLEILVVIALVSYLAWCFVALWG